MAEALESCNAHPDITTLLLFALDSKEPPEEGTGQDSNIFFTGIIGSQTKIGWNLVKYGFLTTEWKAAQHE